MIQDRLTELQTKLQQQLKSIKKTKKKILKECEAWDLSDIQKESLMTTCPACEEGFLHPVGGEGEDYLWCDTCDLSMDSDGGYTN